MSNFITKQTNIPYASTEEIKRLCSYITDDSYIASYLGEPIERVRRVRSETKPKKEGYRSAYFAPHGMLGIDNQAFYERATVNASAQLHGLMLRVYEKTAERMGLASMAEGAVICGMQA
jgi:hypothetical protein